VAGIILATSIYCGRTARYANAAHNTHHKTLIYGNPLLDSRDNVFAAGCMANSIELDRILETAR
jgi:hypothetical protein